MAKGRMINKRIAKSDKLAALAKDRHRVIYFMLYPHLDREGRYSADPRDIKEDCCPRLSYSLGQISESLVALHEVGLIAIYTVNEKQYLEASRFDDFQVGLHKEREAPSEIPPNPGPSPDNSGNCRSTVEKVPLNLKSNIKGKVKVEVEEDEKTPPAADIPDSFLKSAKEGISEIFDESDLSELLDDGNLNYLIRLCWEYKHIPTAEEMKKRFVYKNSKSLTKSNLRFEIRKWFELAWRYEARAGE